MKRKKTDTDNEVYFLGRSGQDTPPKVNRWVYPAIVLFILVCLGVGIFLLRQNKSPETITVTVTQEEPAAIAGEETVREEGYIEIREETVNDVPMYIYIPRHATAELTLGIPDKNDSTLIFVAQAADVRADNGKILGDFVLEGKQIAWGKSKLGFCAILKDRITIGMAEETPLLQQTLEEGGSFFRQYALVWQGNVVPNNPKNKAIRRALGVRNGQVVMIESRSTESFHDFSTALADLGISPAIYLVGSSAYGWLYDKEGERKEFGVERSTEPPNYSYLVWRKKQ